MTLTTRRTFLIGLGAVVAAPAVARLAAITPGPVTPVLLSPRFDFRSIYSMSLGGLASAAEGDSERFVTYSLRRKLVALPIWQISVNSRGFYRWRSTDELRNIISMPGYEIFLEVDPCENCEVMLVANTERDRSKRHKSIVETFTWDGDRVATSLMVLDPRDSAQEFDDTFG